jgi:transcriptional regulator
MVYLPPVFTEARPEVLIQHIDKHDFGLLVSHGPAGLTASHIPFLVEPDGEKLCLLGHLARANPQVGDLASSGEVLAIFSGPHAYISPSWYASAPSVPTWNYTAVHAYGRVRLIEDADGLCSMLRRLSERQEARGATGWRMDDLPESYLEGMLKGIIGLEIAVTRLEGKYKLSQNRPAEDRPRIIAELERRGDCDGLAVARLMRERS